MEFDAMFFVQRTDEIAELRPEHAFERALFGCDHMNVDLAGAQCGGRFEADETGADDDRALGGFGVGDNGTAIVE